MRSRLTLIDEIRGLTLISMILYHFAWDLKYIAGFGLEWYLSTGAFVWQQSICITFIFIAGFSFNLGRHHLRRALTVFGGGLLVTAVTLIFMPENRIVFGVLTFTGSAGLIMIPLNRMHNWLERRILSSSQNGNNVIKNISEEISEKTEYQSTNGNDVLNLNISCAVWALLMFVVFYRINHGTLNVFVRKISLPNYLYKGYFATYLGFTDSTFYSTDYFAILPWIFVYLMGYYFYRILKGTIFADDNPSRAVEVLRGGLKLPWAEFLGRKSLLIYLLHQPVLYAVTLIIMKLFRIYP